LIALLKSDVEHVLVNVVNCIRVLCESYQVIQETFALIEDALVTLVELLGMSHTIHLLRVTSQRIM
jgi:hypothetical protein